MTAPAGADGAVLVVCTGNLCRSPLIQLLLAEKLAGTDISVTSAGTGPVPEPAMDARAAAIAERLGADPTGFVPRLLAPELVQKADLVLTATRRHRGLVAVMHPRALSYAFALGDAAQLAADITEIPPDQVVPPRTRAARAAAELARRRGSVTPGRESEVDVVDPYRRPDELYAQMTEQVQRMLPPVVRLLGGRS